MFFSKASKSVNWLWHKRLSRLNFKNINKLAKQNKVLGLPSLVYSKDKPCSACEKGKHKRASFKTKQNFSIKKFLHLLHMDLFGPVSPMSVNHEKYTLVIVDEYSRTNNGTEFRNSELESFCNEKGISQNFSSPYIPEQNGVAERKNRTLIEAARTMFTNTSVDEIGINDSSRYPLGEFLHEDDASRQYQSNYDISYYIIPHGRSLTELTQQKHVPEVIAPIEQNIPHTENVQSLHDLTNTEGTQELNVQYKQIINQPTEESSWNIFVPEVIQSQNTNYASTSMLTRSMTAKLTAASASECLFVDFKKVSKALKHPEWVDAMQEELNQFYRNKVWLLLILYKKNRSIGSYGKSQKKVMDYDETFSLVERMEDLRIFLAYATYMNFINVKLVFSFVKEIRLRSALDLSLQVTEASTKGPSSVSVTAVISLSEVLTQSSRPEELMLKELQHLKLNYFSLSDLGDFMFKSTKSD
ncbi:retrovirus-related pol polyprotein from transposon TNT 1-94 [Tanacetum coccineum]